MVYFADISHILVPLDEREPSHRAVPVASRLAGRFNVPMTLFHHVPDDADSDSAEAALANVAEAHGGGIVVDTRVAVGGDLVESIVEAAGSAGLTVMGTAASVRFHSGHFGSVAEAVTRTLGRPLALVGPEMLPQPGAPTQRVVVPIDGSPLSEKGIEVGAGLAARLSVPLVVVSVISSKHSAAAQNAGAASVGAEANYVRNQAKAASSTYGIEAHYEVLHRDDPAEAIVDFVGLDGTAIMTTHGRSGLSRLVAGSVAMGVVASSKRAVFVHRPTGD